MTNNNPLQLSRIYICANSSDPSFPLEYPEAERFDARCDFDIDFNQIALSLLLIFTNERYLSADERHASGIRRKVNVSIVDITDNIVAASAVIRVNIPRNYYSESVRCDFPFDSTGINPRHSYKIVIRDEKSGHILGIKMMNLFDHATIGKNPSDWYTVLRGGISHHWSDILFRNVEGTPFACYKIVFYLTTRFLKEPIIMPELEFRLYEPNGKITTKFARPYVIEDDSNEYRVETPYLTHGFDNGICYVELLCMDYPIAGFVFSTDTPDESGEWTHEALDCLDDYSLDNATQRWQKFQRINNEDIINQHTEDDEFEEALDRFISSQEDQGSSNTTDNDCEKAVETLDNNIDHTCLSFQQSLNHLTGLPTVKAKLSLYEKVVMFNRLRKKSGLMATDQPLHSMFLGSPGTGKTTIAKLIGMMLRKAGVLSKGHVVVKERSTLLGQFYNSEAEKTLQAIDEAQGGILLIDEAYQLYQPEDARDPGKFVIEALMTALSDESKRDWMLILAGYPDEMKYLFDMNPGLKSRIPDSNIYTFDDFNELELMEIAEKFITNHQYSLSDEARSALEYRIKTDYSNRSKNFGNARYITNLIQTEIIPAMAARVMSQPQSEITSLSEIQPSDIPSPKPYKIHKSNRIGYLI